MSFFTALVTSKVAAGLLAGGTIAAGGAAAAYTGALPAPLQQGSHDLIGAPAPAAAHPLPDAASEGQDKAADAGTDSDDGAGPDATGPAAFGLCTAFTHGGLDPASTAYKSLAAAADGKGGIAEYCKSIPGPGNSAAHRPDKPGNSDQPGKSDKPGKPDKSDKSGKPDEPGKPDGSSKPDGSGKPDDDDQPGADPSSNRATPGPANSGQANTGRASTAITSQAGKGASHKPAVAGTP